MLTTVSPMRDLLRQPILQFLALGVLLGALLLWLSDQQEPPDEMTIRLTATDLARMEVEWAARWSRPPTPREFDGLVRANVRERVLHREALRMGLDRDEPVVRRVLVQKLERIANDLIELSLVPTDQALQGYFQTNAERYRPEPLITLTQVFVDPDKREDMAVADTEALVAELRGLGEAAASRPDEFGDRFMLQHYYPQKTQQRIAALFGTAFAESTFDLAPGEWHGPVLSGYGQHAVFVHAREDFPVPELDEVRDQVRQDWVDENRREITEKYYEDLLARYEVVVEGQVDEATDGDAVGDVKAAGGGSPGS